MLKDPKPPMIPKETSLTTHPEASTKMYGIKKRRELLLTGYRPKKKMISLIK